MPGFFSYLGRIAILILLLVNTTALSVRAEDSNNDFDADGYDVELGNTYISNHIQSHQQQIPYQHISSDHHHSKKFRCGKHISFQLIFNPAEFKTPVVVYAITTHEATEIKKYDYLFYRNINPPPPKFC